MQTEANDEAIPTVMCGTPNRNPFLGKQPDSAGHSSIMSDPLSDVLRIRDVFYHEGCSLTMSFVDLESSVKEILDIICSTRAHDEDQAVVEYLLHPWRARGVPEVTRDRQVFLEEFFRREDARINRLDFLLRRMHAFVDQVFFDRRMLGAWATEGDGLLDLQTVIFPRLRSLFDNRRGLKEFLEILSAFGMLWARLRLTCDTVFLDDIEDMSKYSTYCHQRLSNMGAWREVYRVATGNNLTGALRAPSSITAMDADELLLLAGKISAHCRTGEFSLRLTGSETTRGMFVYDVSWGTTWLFGFASFILLAIIVAFSILQLLAIGSPVVFAIVVIGLSILTGCVSTFVAYSYGCAAKHLQAECKWHQSPRHSMSFERQWMLLCRRFGQDPPSKGDLVTGYPSWDGLMSRFPEGSREVMEAALALEAFAHRGSGARRVLCCAAFENATNFLWWASIPLDYALGDRRGNGLDTLFARQTLQTGGGTVRDDNEQSGNILTRGLRSLAPVMAAPTSAVPMIADPTKMPELVDLPLANGQRAYLPTKTLQRDIIIIGVVLRKESGAGGKDTVFLWNTAAEDATGVSSSEAVGRKISMLMDSQSVSNLASLLKQKKMYEYRIFTLCARKGGVVTIRARLATCNVAFDLSSVNRENREIILIGSAIEQTDWYPFTYMYRLYSSVLQQLLRDVLETIPTRLTDMLEVMDCDRLKERASLCHGWLLVTSSEMRDIAKKASAGMALVIVDSSVDESFYCDKQEMISATQALVGLACGVSDRAKASEGVMPIVVSLTQRSYNESACLQIRVELRPEFVAAGGGSFSADSKRYSPTPFRVERRHHEPLRLSEGLILVTPDEGTDASLQNVTYLYVPISKYRLNSLSSGSDLRVQDDGATLECCIYAKDAIVRMYLQRELQFRHHTVRMCATADEAMNAVRSNLPDAVFVDSGVENSASILQQLKGVRASTVGGTLVVSVHTENSKSDQMASQSGIWTLGSDFVQGWPPLRDQLIKNKGHREIFHFAKEEANFVRKGLLGRGATGDVYEYEDPVTNAKVAVKEMSAGTFSDTEALTREINIMRQFDHRNIVRYIKAQLHQNTLLIFMEKCDTSLESEISGKRRGGYLIEGGILYASNQLINSGVSGLPPPLSVLRERVEQLISGVLFLHNQGIVHRDIKPANILIKSNVIKISDFGSASYNNKGGETTAGGLRGTLPFMAPEMHNGGVRGRRDACDIWSLGLTILAMIQSTPLEISECRDLPDYAALYSPPGDRGIAIGEDGVPIFTFPPMYSAFRNQCLGPDGERDRDRVRRRMTCVGTDTDLYRAIMQFEADIKESEGLVMDLARRCLRFRAVDRDNALRLLAHPLFEAPAVASAAQPASFFLPLAGADLNFSPTEIDGHDPLHVCRQATSTEGDDNDNLSASGNSW